MVISLTTKQFNKYWHFLRYQVPVSQRKEVLKTYFGFKDLVDKNTTLEIRINAK